MTGISREGNKMVKDGRAGINGQEEGREGDKWTRKGRGGIDGLKQVG